MSEPPPVDFACKECEKSFGSRRGLHLHIRKAHKQLLENYYCLHYPRYNLLTKQPLRYKDSEGYFSKDFEDESEMYKWLHSADPRHRKRWMLETLEQRIKSKSLKFAPSHVELSTIKDIPNGLAYRHFFKSYSKACDLLSISPLFEGIEDIGPLGKDGNPLILIDTREQQPLPFKKSKKQKLAFGDYSLGGNDYTYTYVERKSAADFKSTMTQGFDRFKAEVKRCSDMDSYLYVVVEDSIRGIEEGNDTCAHPISLPFVFKRMRDLHHAFPRRIQFVFTGNRKNSVKIIPLLLQYGERLWSVDVQLILEIKKAL